MMEKLAVEFQHDPVTFCWVDLEACSTEQRRKWETQFRELDPQVGSSTRVPRKFNCLLAIPSWNNSQHLNTVSAFVVACSYKGKKIAMHKPSEHVSMDDLRNWIPRLVGGEISQQEAIPDLFA